MMPENNSNFNGDEQPLKPEATGNDDIVQDISNSDAPAENARETERIQEASRAAGPSFQIDADSDERQIQNAENHANPDDDEPATTHGTEEEIEENLSGTTNLSLDQLKKEGDPGGHPLEGEEA